MPARPLIWNDMSTVHRKFFSRFSVNGSLREVRGARLEKKSRRLIMLISVDRAAWLAIMRMVRRELPRTRLADLNAA